MEEALDDDMNTAVALSEVLAYKGGDATEFAYALDLLGITPRDAWLQEPVRELPADLLARLREHLNGAIGGDDVTPEEAIERVIAMRAQARAQKNWAESDRLRDVLLSCGIAVKDSKEGTTWSIAEPSSISTT